MDSCERSVEASCVEPGALDLEGSGVKQGLWPTTWKATTRPALEAWPTLDLKPRLDVNLRNK